MGESALIPPWVPTPRSPMSLSPVQLSKMHASALTYARWGWRVFPLHTPRGSGCSCGASTCGNAGKHPRTRHGFRDATTDEATIAAWWAEWPDANVGIATGPESGLLVVDIDPRNGGDDSFDELVHRIGALPETPEVLTGGGGRHLFFRWPDGVESLRAKPIGSGIDIKGAGGYVVAAPSLHASGRVYGWEASSRPGDVPLADVPPALLAMLSAPRPAHGPAGDGDALGTVLGKAFAHAGMLGRSLGQGRHAVVCPWEHEHTSGARFDSSTAIFPAKAGSGLGGFTCLHSHCAGRTWRDVVEALPREAVQRARAELPLARPPLELVNPAPVETVDEHGEVRSDWMQLLVLDKKERPKATPANLAIVPSHDPAWAGCFGWDTFSQVVSVRRPPPFGSEGGESTTGELTDSHVARTRYAISRAWGWDFAAATVLEAITTVAEAHPFHPVREYLEGVRWDGICRIDSWLSTYLGVEPSAYVSDVGRTFLVGAVARILSPGCKLDTMLILEGSQGAGKSTAVRALFSGPWTLDTPLDLASKDRFSALRGKWAIEHAELDALGKHDKERVKAFVSSAVDRYRPSYARLEVTQPRQCVFVGSTNQETYLDDETGGRRFNGVKVGAIDTGGLTRDRDLLWAEAREAYRSGATWWPDPALVPVYREEQSARRKVDEWERLVSTYVLGRHRVLVGDILSDALGLEAAKWTAADQTRVRRALTAMGWTQRRARGEGGERQRYYYPPGGEEL